MFIFAQIVVPDYLPVAILALSGPADRHGEHTRSVPPRGRIVALTGLGIKLKTCNLNADEENHNWFAWSTLDTQNQTRQKLPARSNVNWNFRQCAAFRIFLFFQLVALFFSFCGIPFMPRFVVAHSFSFRLHRILYRSIRTLKTFTPETCT